MSPIISLKIGNGAQSRYLNFLLDTGSDLSLINDKLAKPFAKCIKRTKKKIACFQTELNLTCNEINLAITGTNSKTVTCKMLSVPHFNIKYNLPNLKDSLSKYCHYNLSPSFKRSVDSIRHSELKVHGILGVDLLPLLLKFSIVQKDNGSFVEVGDGLVPVGSVDATLGVHYCNSTNKESPRVRKQRKRSKLKNSKNSVKACESATPSQICYAMKQVFDTKNRFDILPDFVAGHLEDQFSIANHYGEDSDKVPPNNYETFKHNITFKKGKYSVKVPFQQDILDKVPDSYSVCKVLAKKVYHKLANDQQRDDYFDYFKDQCQNKIITPLESNFNLAEHRFVPHRPVIREDPLVKTTKLRAVFNCSFRHGNKPSLNDCVQFPQDSIKDLVDLFLYFRSNRYFVTADIEKAFLNINLNSESDSRKFSFIVYNRGQFFHYRYTSVLFGFVMSPFFLNSVLKFHADLLPDPTVSNLIKSNFYIDNLILVHHSKDYLNKYSGEISDELHDAGFNLRAWNANYEGATTLVSGSDTSCNTAEAFKILGMVHQPSDDAFTIKAVSLDENASTRRQFLSGMASIFDPCGYILPVTSYGKLLLRNLTQLGLSWDEEVPQEASAMWQALVKQMDKLASKITVPRHAYNSNEPFALHVFTDASTELVGTAVYVAQGEHSHLLFAKCKLSPPKSKTIPTLELLAFELASKIVQKIISAPYFQLHNLQCINFYSDSQVALSWVLSRMAPKRNLFACHRVKSINNILDSFTASNIKFQITYVPTADNVADMLTRPRSTLRFLKVSELYLNGPTWLTQGGPPVTSLQSIPVRHVKDKKLIYSIQIIDQEGSVCQLNKFSKYTRAVNTMAYVYKAIDLFRKRQIDPFVIYKTKATNYFIKSMQSQYFPVEVNYLSNVTSMPKNPPKLIAKLNLFLDTDGILRSKGRIAPSLRYSYDVTNPVLIAGESEFTALLISHAHNECKHLGANTTLYYLRNMGFWLTKARVNVASCVAKCLTCLKYRAKTFESPPMAILPSARTEHYRPFECVGIDYTGHFMVKNSAGSLVKSYILLFTCMTTRAVHLELVETMGVGDFLNAFIRFSGRYGLPMEVFSDNARTFTASSGLLQSVINHDMVVNFLTSRNILFKTIPVYSPNQGGSWERVVGIVKRVLNKTYGKSTFTFDQFRTILVEVQCVINNRPLCYNSSSQELDIISPAMLINQGSSFPIFRFNQNSLNNSWHKATDKQFLQGVFQQLKFQESSQDKFIEEWLRAYILDLRNKHGVKSHYNPTQARWLKEGSVCMHKTPQPTAHYPLVVITKLLPAKDGSVRNVVVKSARGAVTVVSITNLSPLEINIDEGEDPSLNPQDRTNIANPDRDAPSGFPSTVTSTASSSLSQQPSTSVASVARPQRRAAAASQAATKARALQGII